MNKTSNSIFKIVVVHEDLITGIEAAVVLRRLAAGLDAEFEIKSNDWQIDSGVWKFEMLHDPELWELAVAEAVEADMIFISASKAELPTRVRNWIESVLPMKAGGPAALVALLGGSRESSANPPDFENRLRRLAEQSGLDFFCNTDSQPPFVESDAESSVSCSEGDSAICRSLHQNCSQQPWTSIDAS